MTEANSVMRHRPKIQVITSFVWLAILFLVPAQALGQTTPDCETVLTNGSFEQPMITGQSQLPNQVAGWTLDQGSSIELQRLLGGNAAHGAQWLELAGTDASKVSQQVTVTPGATYELRFAYSPRPGGQFTGDNEFQVLWDNVPVFDARVSQPAGTTQWQRRSLVVQGPPGGMGELAFEDLSGGDAGAGMLIDDVRLCHASAPACDSPCCLGACCIGDVCIQTTGEHCQAEGGVFHGEDSRCTLGNCEFDDLCFPSSQRACEEQGGEYLADEPCPVRIDL